MQTQTQTVEGFRLSPAQKRLWQLHASRTPSVNGASSGAGASADAPRLGSCVQCVALAPRTPDISALRRALHKVVSRHEALRTHFFWRVGVRWPLQVIAPRGEVTVREADAEGEEFAEVLERELEAEWRVTAGRTVLTEAWLPGAEPEAALRACVVRAEGDVRCALVLSAPELCADERSLRNLVRELEVEYAREAAGGAGANGNGAKPAGGEEEGVSYAQYAEWQNELLESEEAAEGRSFWLAASGGAEAPLRLGIEARRKAGQTDEAGAGRKPSPVGVERWELSEELSRRVSETAASLGVGEQAVLLACWQVVLWRSSERWESGSNSETEVWVRFAGRPFAELEGAVGPYAQDLPVRASVGGDYQLAELAAQAAKTLEAASSRQEYYGLGLDEGDGEGDVEDAAAVEVCAEGDGVKRELEGVGYAYGAVGRCAGACGGGVEGKAAGVCAGNGRAQGSRDACACWAVEEIRAGLSGQKLRLVCERAGERLRGTIDYSREVYDAASAQLLAERWRQVLAGAVEAGGRVAAGRVEILGELERRLLLSGWNDTRAEHPKAQARCIQQLFEEQAARTPDALAVVFRDERVTYGELNRRANQLAHHLRELGVGPDVIVGVCVERSVEMVVGLLGILKAGGAYLPLDPSYPMERLSFMLEDAVVSVMLTLERLEDALPIHWGHTLYLDGDREDFARHSVENPSHEAGGDNLAYVIYTSGSTGRPKGVQISHRNLVMSTAARFAFYREPVGNFLLLPSFAFDSSVAVIFWTLCAGGSLTIPEEGAQRDTLRLARLVSAEAVTHVLTLPSLYSALLASSAPDELRSLRAVMVAGEACPREVVRQHFHALPGASLFNEYGPTEGTVWSSVYECVPDEPKGEIPIGRAIPNTQAYVLDERWQPVPVGVPGELYLGGAGLARNYFRRPAQTAERFVPHAFAASPGERLYRTGDVARYLPDGNLEFLGRADQQVKVRGYRIELGEIEAALLEHGRVREAVVAARDDAGGGRRLVAYVVADGGSVSSSELQSHLRERLPEYMVPSAVVALKELPLTPNGKVDRKALPAPELLDPDNQRSYVAPRSAVEKGVAAIYSEVLNVERVGLEHSFFELGGHSLLATQLISRLRDVFGVEVSLRSVFEKPTVGALSTDVEAALRAERKLYTPPVAPVERDGALPLSFAQQRLWFIDQLEPGNAFYNVPLAIRLAGRLDLGALEQTFSAIVERHEVLRTSFPTVGGRPVQHVSPPAPVPFSVEDLTTLPHDEREEEAQRLAREEASRPFDLSRGPLLRVRLLKLSDDEHVCLLTMHHIISDGWSMGILIREVGALYDAFARGEESPLPELPIQYADFAVWQREWLRDEVLEAQMTYWRERLGGELPSLELPTDRPRPAVPTHRGANLRFTLDPEVSRGLRDLAGREGATLFMVLLAAFKVLLSRYSGQTDIVVGTDIAGRNRAETEGLIGFFVNQLVLRTELSGEPSFADVVRRVREVCLGAYAHQDVPFEKLVEELQPERSLGRTPLFQVKMVLQNVPRERLAVGGLEVSLLEMSNRLARFDLLLGVTEIDEETHVGFEYSTDLFDAETVERMAAHFHTLLRAAAADADTKVARLPLLGEEERRRLVVDLNDTARDFPRDACVHELFEQQAARTPGAVALVYGEGEMTYGELNRRANQLAHYLRSVGVGAEHPVGICVERGPLVVVGLLAILKAGGVYVPLDPEYPAERLSFMMEDAGVSVLLTQESLIDQLPVHWGHTVCLDDPQEAAAVEQCAAEDPPRAARADNLAYVVYTSGSTGTPKGVQVDHRAVLRLLVNTDYVNVQASDRVAQASNPSFDAITFELWGALLHGASLLLVEKDVALSPKDFAAYLRAQRVSVMFLTTALFNQVAGEEPTAFGHMRAVLFGGEAVDPKWVREVLCKGRPERLLHVYGPTETTTFATWKPVEEVAEDAPTVPIGRPIANTEAYLLDDSLSPVPFGVPGQLFLGGPGLARGYLNRPALTAERFVPHPFSSVPGARLYRTGDVCRRVAGGEIEFMGRADGQVKLRGHRIELGEVEAALRRLPGVREAAAAVKEDAAGERRLVAYVVSDEGDASRVAALREALRERLPEYMVPSAVVALEELPLTRHGKVDRKALPEPEVGRAELGGSGASPRTPTEELVAGIFASVLGVSEVGRGESFFDLGGHSLLATRAVSRVREVFGVELPLRSIFERPTVRELSEDVEQRLAEGDGRTAPPVTAVPRDGRVLPLSFAQQRLWFIDQLEPDSPLYNVPLVIRLAGALDVAALEQTFSAVVERHEVLRTSFPILDGQPVQHISPPSAVNLSVEDLTTLPDAEREEEARRRAREEAARPFDLARGPLLRVRLLKLSDGEHVCLLTMHHIVSDGWSLEVLSREVGALYDAFSRGEESPLPELEVQYADFAVWQREWLRDEVLEAQMSYWRKRLGGDLPVLELPTDRPRPAAPTYGGARHGFTLSDEASGALKELAAREGATLFMVLLAAFKVLLSRYSGQTDIAVGTPIAGRNRGETEGLVGFFVNTLVLRTELSGEPSFVEVVRRVRETCLGAYAHQDVPFEKLVEELQPERDLSRTPLFQAMFALQNMDVERPAMRGIDLDVMETNDETAKFELSLSVFKSEGGISGNLEYQVELFDPATVERMVESFVRLLESAVRTPELPLSELSLLSERQREQLLFEWNSTDKDYPRELCLHELFEAQAATTPDAAAVLFGSERLSYRELNERANQLARHLQEMSVGPEVLVGICVERSVEMLVGVLAVLKAGGAYVPLDAAYPRERLAYMLEETQAPVLLTQQHLLERLPQHRAATLCLDADWPAVATRSGENLTRAAHPANAAYVIYTSGSTGRPKGSVVTHESLVGYALEMRERLSLREDDRFLQFASLSFDVFAEEVFPTWAAGACVVLVEHSLLASVSDLTRVLSEQGVTGCELPTAYWHEWVRELEARGEAPPSSLRFVIIGGEPALDERVRGWLRFGVELFNVYGLTEVTVTSTVYALPAGAREPRHATLPVGRPIANTRAYILDERWQAVPVGVPGELYLGGRGLARNYFRRPAQTAERFLPDPFSSVPGSRLYRTGDVARYLPDGEIEFVGRRDRQVKVRGYRIELGEIEAALGGHPNVREALVSLRGNDADEQRLVAYVIPRDGAAGSNGNGHEPPVEFWPSHGEYPVYDELLYYAMERDVRRNDAYREAIRRFAQGKTVVDVGTGGDAVLTRLCVEGGAAKVYAIERMDESFRLAQATVRRAGLQSKVELIHGDAVEVELPEQVDVCISELIGTVGSSEGAAAILNSARRFLKPGGVMIPSRCTTKIAAVTLPAAAAQRPRFTEAAGFYAEKVFEAVGRPFDLRVCVKNFPPSHLLSNEEVFEDLDFNQPTPTEQSRRVRLEISRDGQLDGFLLWINLHVFDDDTLDSLREECSWLPLYCPAFDGGTQVRAGDVLELECESRPGDNGVNPDYRIAGVLRRGGGDELAFEWVSRHHGSGYKQSAFYRSLLEEEAEQVSAHGVAPAAHTHLREHLRARLPEYMVPSSFVLLEEWPLTANGKIDVRALPEPERTRAASGKEYVAPRTHAETELAGIFSQLLRVERVGVNDSFFELGGHSLLATQLLSRIRNAFRVELPLRAVFMTPTVAQLSESVEAATHDRRGERDLPPLVPAERDGALPLSFAQQRLWFIDQIESGSAFYNVPLALRLSGPLDLGALEQTFSAVVERHEVLRTSFPTIEGNPVQHVSPPAPVKLSVEDLTTLPDAEREEEARRRAREEAARPFDLARGPLLRVRLLKLSDGEHVCLLTMHHIVSDGWSLGVLGREVGALYDAFSRGEQSPLAPLPVQYADYAVWQRSWLRGEVLEGQMRYWRERLGGELPVLELPTDRPRPATQSHHGARHGFTLSPEVSGALKELAAREGTTLFMVLLAAFKVLLSRYTGQTDIVVGTDIAGRNLSETEGLVGFFVNQLVLRTDISGEPTFAEVVRRVREVCLEAYAHQDVPFEKLVEELQPERNLNRSPLFQAKFLLQNIVRDPLGMSSLQLEPLDVENPSTRFDLLLSLDEREQGLSGAWVYSTDLFDRSTVERMAAHFQRLLGAVAAEADARPVTRLPLLGEEERRRLVVEYNDTARDFPQDVCVHELFEQQAARTPDTEAVVYEGEALTYAELNERANRLAHYLRSLGVGAETLVGLCVERSAEMIVGLLGILKAGGAYVPLDPNYPAERLAFMLKDARVSVLLTQERLLGRLPADGAKVVCVDGREESAAVAASPADNPSRVSGAGNLAYVIYTSGSTGKPKGVMVSHRNLAHLRRALDEAVYGRLPGGVRVSLNAPLSFDASVKQWLRLASGQAVVVIPEAARLDAAALLEYLNTHRVGVFDCGPAQLRALWGQASLDEGAAGESLRALLVGGEAIDEALWARLRESGRRSGRRYFNVYGPTEATVDTAIADVCESGERPVLGHVVTNAAGYVLDARGGPVPEGVRGELYVGGAGLARGYLNSPALTAERFVPDPFSGEAGARLYRTGDLCRRLEGGAIEFVGRADEQVKVRGHRVELGEVEAALRGLPGVREVAAAIKEDVAGEPRLVGYVVLDEGADASALRDALGERLPEYALPSAIVTLDRLPLTRHGKVDRRALPEPELARGRGYVAPRNPTEELVAGIFGEVLGAERVGAEDNFFDLGGHSLLAVHLILRVREALSTELSLRSIFEAPTVAGLSAMVERQRVETAGQVLPGLRVERQGNKSIDLLLSELDELTEDE